MEIRRKKEPNIKLNIQNILGKSSFTQRLIALNALQFNKWIFEPGMLFSSEMKWWGEKERRGSPHNGLDLLFYEASDGKLKTIVEGTRVPLIYGGKIVRVIRDFIGYTAFALHEIYHEGSQLFTIYGHIMKSPDVSMDEPLGEGAVIATLAGQSNKSVPGHLHISAALIPVSISIEMLTWELIDNNEAVRFFDPRRII